MATSRDDAKLRDAARARNDRGPGPARLQTAPVAPRMGAFRWVTIALLATSTLALLAIAGLTALLLLQSKTTDVAALKQDIAGVKTETAAFHADVSKSIEGLQKGLSETANQVNSATLQLNDIALSLHKRPAAP